MYIDEFLALWVLSQEIESAPWIQSLYQAGLFILGKVTSLGEWKLWIQASCTLLKKLTLCHILFMLEQLGKYLHLSIWTCVLILGCIVTIFWPLYPLTIFCYPLYSLTFREFQCKSIIQNQYAVPARGCLI